MNITRTGNDQLAGRSDPSNIITHRYGETAAVDVMAVQIQRDRLDIVYRPQDVRTLHAGIPHHRHRIAVHSAVQRRGQIHIVHRLTLVRARHLRRKHRAAPIARAVRAHIAVVAGKAAPVGADFHRADGEAMFVGQHRVVLPIRQHSDAVLVVAGQILLQIAAAGILRVVVAVYDGVLGRSGVLIHQIDRVARLQQVGHHLRVRAARRAQHLDLPDLHRALAGDLDAVLIRGDDLRVAAVLYRHMSVVCPQRTHAAGLFLGAVDDGQGSSLNNMYRIIAHLATVQVQREAVDSSRKGHVAPIVRQQRDNGVIRPVLHRGLCILDGRVQRVIIHSEIHHPRIAGRADAVVIPCRMGAGRAADAARLALPVDVVGGMLYDGHRRIVQVDALGPLGIARVYNSTVRLIKVLDGLSVRVAVGPALRQHLLQLSHQLRPVQVHSGIIDAVGVLVGDKRAPADLHLAQVHVSAADVQTAL